MQVLRAEELTILAGFTHGISLHAIHAILRPLLARSLADSPPFAEPRGNGGETEGKRREDGGRMEHGESPANHPFLNSLTSDSGGGALTGGSAGGRAGKALRQAARVHAWFRGKISRNKG